MPFITQGKTNLKYILIVVILAIIIGGGGLWWATKQKVSPIPLSSIAEKIEQEQVESITIQGINIEAVLKDGTHLYSKKETETSFSEALLSYGVTAEKLKNVRVEIKGEKLLTTWFGPLLLFILPFIGFIGWLLVFYFLILLGFRVLKIEGIPRFKIAIYIFVMFLFASFLQPVIIKIFENILNKPSLYLINTLISLGITFLLLKYYFLLSGKKLWQFLLYLIVLSLVFSGIFTLIQLL